MTGARKSRTVAEPTEECTTHTEATAGDTRREREERPDTLLRAKAT